MNYKKAITGIICLIVASTSFGQKSTAQMARDMENERQRNQSQLEYNKRLQQGQNKRTYPSYSNESLTLAEKEKIWAKEREDERRKQLEKDGKYYRNFSEVSDVINKNGLRRVRIYPKYGFIDGKDEIQIGVIYDFASETFYNGLVSVTIGNQIGYVDEKGKLIIPYSTERTKAYEKPELFDTNRPTISKEPILSFNEGLATKRVGDKYGCIDIYGKVIIPFIYDIIYEFGEGGLAIVKLNGKFGFINAKGKAVIPIKYDCIGFFADGLSLAQIGNKWGYINLKDKQVIPIIYDDLAYFINGKVEFKLKGKSFYFDRTGKKISGQSPVAPKK